MNQNLQRETATIYQFPVGGRASVRSGRDGQRKVADVAAVRHDAVDFGSSWYHDVAIAEDKGRKG